VGREGKWRNMGGEDRGGEGEGGEGKGREGRAPPNILLHPQFQFSRNMPGSRSNGTSVIKIRLNI